MQTIQTCIAQLMQGNGSELIYQEVVKAIRGQDLLWAAVSPATRNYYIGMEHGEYAAYLFSEKAFAEQFQEELAKKNITVGISENKAANRMLLFGDLLRSGVTVLVIDNGQQYIAVSLFELMDELEGQDPEHADRIVMNPRLLSSAHYFFQQAASRRADTAAECAMLLEISRASYITPIRIQDGAPSLPTMQGENGGTYMMCFTDWPEFRRGNLKGQFSHRVIRFSEIQMFLESMEGIAINPFGMNLVLDREMLDAVQKAVDGTLQLPAEKLTLGGEDRISITAPPETAQPMLDAAAELLQNNKKVNAAYLRMIEKDTQLRPSYLVIVDASCELKELYGVLAEKMMPLAKGLDIEFVSYQEDFGRQAAGNAKPFYKKRRFRLFG